jgi:hypothetical protein
MNAHALPRLLMRRMLLWTLFPLFWAFAIPLMVAAERGASLGALLSGAAPAAARIAAVQLGVLVPAVIGVAAAIARVELQHTLFSWTLPGVRRGLLAGTGAIALLLAVASALSAALTALPGAVPGAVAAAFALALLWFATSASTMDVAVPRALRWLCLLALAAAVVRPGALLRLTDSAPWFVTLAAGTAAAALVAVQFSRGAARRRLFLWSSVAPVRTALYWAGRRTPVQPWRGTLATDRLGPWLRGLVYEASSRGGMTLPLLYLVFAVVTVLSAHLTAQPGQALILAGIFLVQGRLGLSSGLSYPLSRRRRADLAAAAALLEAAAFTGLLVLVVLAVHALEVPVPTWFADDAGSRYGWGPTIGMTFVWAPLAQWGVVVWPGAPWSSVDARRFLLFMAFVIPAMLSARLVAGLDPLPLVAVVAAAGAAGYTIFWLAARRHFARADLVQRAA